MAAVAQCMPGSGCPLSESTLLSLQSRHTLQAILALRQDLYRSIARSDGVAYRQWWPSQCSRCRAGCPHRGSMAGAAGAVVRRALPPNAAWFWRVVARSDNLRLRGGGMAYRRIAVRLAEVLRRYCRCARGSSRRRAYPFKQGLGKESSRIRTFPRMWDSRVRNRDAISDVGAAAKCAGHDRSAVRR